MGQKLFTAVQKGKSINGEYYFQCPGCKNLHGINSRDWNFNNNLESPTFYPSYLIGRHSSPTARDFAINRCHSYITDGKIQFLTDCHHDLAGQTVPLKDINGA